MTLITQRIESLHQLGEVLSLDTEQLQQAKQAAESKNAWFTQANIDYAFKAIAKSYLQKGLLQKWVKQYPNISNVNTAKKIGIVMAGNIPLVGFHDFLCAYICGYQIRMKLSSKDTVLWNFILEQLQQFDSQLAQQVLVMEMLKGCDAYIATGSNNTARYFEYYFQNYPHIIRKNRTSVALLNGNESEEQLNLLANDIATYYGLGCRNVSKLMVPKDYDFTRLLSTLEKLNPFLDFHKYKNNYDYQLTLCLMNQIPHLTNDAVILIENKEPHAAISTLHYEYYDDATKAVEQLLTDENVQIIVSNTQNFSQHIKLKDFGNSQTPALSDYADGVDTMQFLTSMAN